ncbi:MAG: MFS transporter [Actinophytocola sp.]|uniref:MFS transporter n=1 Tax=Actinophytocola sp. TaxID=1872138 RepID=UPI003D6C4540
MTTTRPLWRNRDFMLLWSGQVVSTVGMRISSLAYPLLVLAETGSALQAGVVGFAQTLPFLLLYLPAGALVDRLDRRRVMLAADGVRVAVLASVVAALSWGEATLTHLVLAVFLDGACFVFFQLAESAALPHLVHRAQLPTALAQNQARENGAELAGQPLGGVLFAIGHAVPFAVNAASFAVSLLSLLFIRPRLQGPRERINNTLLADIAEGLTWLWRQRFLRAIVVLIGATNIVLNALPLVLIVRAQGMGASPALIGVLLSFSGLAAILGAFAAPWLHRRLPGRVVIIGSLWVWAAGTAVLVAMPTPLALGAAAGAGAAIGPAFNVVVNAYRYALAPDHLQARTQSAGRMIAWGTIPLAPLVAGVLLAAIGSTGTLLVLAAFMGAVALVASLLDLSWPRTE